MISDAQVDAFIYDGFIRVAGAFSPETAAQCRAIIRRDIDHETPHTVRGLPGYADEPFTAAANTTALHAAFDRLVGEGCWVPRRDLGGIVVRFPGDTPARVDGWHVDVSFPGDGSITDPPDYMTWRANIASRGSALLMFFLFSDVGTDDAPTRLRAGSHHDTARVLAPAGPAGLDARELARRAADASAHRPVAYATGDAGDVYLCHPFLVHAGQPNRGTAPRFLGQPKLEPARPLRPGRPRSPVELAIRSAIGQP